MTMKKHNNQGRIPYPEVDLEATFIEKSILAFAFLVLIGVILIPVFLWAGGVL